MQRRDHGSVSPRPDAPEPPETALAESLARRRGWLPALSLVAVTDNAVIGRVVCARGFVDDTPALGLGPISVLPDRQGRGAGRALMPSVLGAADASGEPLVALLGDPAFYQRFASSPPRSSDRRARPSLGNHFPGGVPVRSHAASPAPFATPRPSPSSQRSTTDGCVRKQIAIRTARFSPNQKGGQAGKV